MTTPDEHDQIDGPLLEALGTFIVRWAFIDRTLSSGFVNVLGADRALSYVMTQNVMANTIHGWMRTAVDWKFHFKESPELTEFYRVLTHIDEMRAERNALVHGLWKRGPEPNTAVVQTIRLDRREVIKEQLMTLTDLVDLLQDATEILIALDASLKALGLQSAPGGRTS